jgi:hypothetical protein
MHALPEEMRGMRMPEIVEADPRQIETLHHQGKRIAEPIRHPERPIGRGADQPLIVMGWPPKEPVFRLSDKMLAKGLSRESQ